ncbi:IS110 family transposase [Streptomyces sp. NPDC087422]|uniref:IS110 family transposase n=1 Tax=Streptomyces sp. NPDC087422 TaxID=3365786 RepID=UPI003827B7ED
MVGPPRGVGCGFKLLPLVAAIDGPHDTPRRLGCQLGDAHGRSVGNRQRGRPWYVRTARRTEEPRGRRLLSRRVAKDEPELLHLPADILDLGDEVTRGIDLADGGAALVIAVLLNHGQRAFCISGRAINRASEGYRGEDKTDTKDAAVTADQTRIRRNLQVLRTGDETATDLKLLTAHHSDLVGDRTRTVNRLHIHLTGIFPALDRVLDLIDAGPLMLLTGYQTPAALRPLGTKPLASWLRNRGVRGADQAWYFQR